MEMRKDFFESRWSSKMVSPKGTEAPPRRDPHIQFVVHQGKKILLLDLSNCSAGEVENTMRDLPDVVTAQARGSVLVLCDFRGSSFSEEAIRSMKEVAVFNKPYVNKSAWVGADSLPKNAAEQMEQFSRRTFRTFPSRDRALAWLVQD